MKTIVKQLIAPAIFILSIFVTLNANGSSQKSTPLTQKEKSLVSISSYTAQGKVDDLQKALNEGLDAGLTINEINEALVQLYAYCGFPRSLTALGTLRTVVDERKENGITDEVGKEVKANDNVEDKYEQGKKVLEELMQRPLSRPTPGFGETPRMDTFLKEHLFADIFSSDVLDYRTREIVTISALASLTGAEPQLGAHLGMGMNVGVTADNLKDIFSVIQNTVEKEQYESVSNLLQNMLNRAGN